MAGGSTADADGPTVQQASDDIDITERFDVLCSNIGQWMTLQSDEVAAFMLRAQEEHVDLFASLDVTAEGFASTHATPPSTPQQLPPLSPPPAARPAADKSREITTTGFSSINTVLAARHRRLNLPQRSPPPPQPALDIAAPPPPPSRLPVTTRDTAHGKALLDALARWQHNAARRVRGRLLAAVSDAARVALAAAVCRWNVAACARIAEARSPWRRAAPRRALRHARRCAWRHWCLKLASSTRQRDSLARSLAAAARHRSSTLTWRAWRVWRYAELRCRTLLEVGDRVHDRRVRESFLVGIRRWQAWLRRRAKWRGQVERRAGARGGVFMLHRPSMQRFDRRAVFIEEGSAAMADAYRRRRTLAVVLSRWWVEAVSDRDVVVDADNRDSEW